MLSKRKQIALSKFLSLILRHKPEVAGLSLDSAGWVEIKPLLAALDRHKKIILEPDEFF